MFGVKSFTFSFAALLMATGCNQKPAEIANNGEAANISGNAVETPSESDASELAPDLGAYVGKHPSEKVADLTFLEQPSVKAAVTATVPDTKVRDFVFHYNGPDAPIVRKDGRILAWGCEVHNCGYHNWSISITPDGNSADVCFYHDDDKPDGPARWYLSDGKTEIRPGNCPSE